MVSSSVFSNIEKSLGGVSMKRGGDADCSIITLKLVLVLRPDPSVAVIVIVCVVGRVEDRVTLESLKAALINLHTYNLTQFMSKGRQERPF